MSETAFKLDENLTQQFRSKAGLNITIGDLRSDTMYHVDFEGMKKVGRKQIPVIVRLYKVIDDRDNIEMKISNTLLDKQRIKEFVDANVHTLLRNSTGCQIPSEVQVGPLENGVLKFWPRLEPINYTTKGGMPYNFIGFQISDHAPGISLSMISKEQRQDPVFLKKIGEQVGRILAQFHHAAREVDLPLVEPAKNHTWRHGVRNPAAVIADDADDIRYRGLAQLFHDDIEAIFKSPTRFKHHIHGNMAMEMLSVHGDRVTRLDNFTYARLGLREMDFRALVLFPEALDASIAAYKRETKKLTGKNVRIDKGLILKLAGSIHASSVYKPKFPRGGAAIDPQDLMQSQIRLETVALSKVLDQLEKIDRRYADEAKLVRDDAAIIKKNHPDTEFLMK